MIGGQRWMKGYPTWPQMRCSWNFSLLPKKTF
jgi:hypothetical protein